MSYSFNKPVALVAARRASRRVRRALALTTVAGASILAAGPAHSWPKIGGWVGQTFEAAKHTTGRNWEGAKRDASNAGQLVAEGVDAGVNLVPQAVKSTIDVVNNINWDGNFSEALGTLVTSPLQGGRVAVRKGLDDSVVLRALVQIGITATLGPVGGGAFAGLYTWEVTGSFDKGLQVGSIAAITVLASKGVLGAPGPSLADGVTAKAVVASTAKVVTVGAISGAGYAVQDGSFEDGFRQGAIYGAAHEVYAGVVGEAPKATPGKGANSSPVPMVDAVGKLTDAVAGDMSPAAKALATVPSTVLTAVAVGGAKVVKKPKKDEASKPQATPPGAAVSTVAAPSPSP